MNIFRENGLQGMMEEEEYFQPDVSSPFLETIIDRGCGETTEVPATAVVTKYVLLVKQNFERNKIPESFSRNLLELLEGITVFKKKATETFLKYQS